MRTQLERLMRTQLERMMRTQTWPAELYSGKETLSLQGHTLYTSKEVQFGSWYKAREGQADCSLFLLVCLTYLGPARKVRIVSL